MFIHVYCLLIFTPVTLFLPRCSPLPSLFLLYFNVFFLFVLVTQWFHQGVLRSLDKGSLVGAWAFYQRLRFWRQFLPSVMGCFFLIVLKDSNFVMKWFIFSHCWKYGLVKVEASARLPVSPLHCWGFGVGTFHVQRGLVYTALLAFGRDISHLHFSTLWLARCDLLFHYNETIMAVMLTSRMWPQGRAVSPGVQFWSIAEWRLSESGFFSGKCRLDGFYFWAVLHRKSNKLLLVKMLKSLIPNKMCGVLAVKRVKFNSISK